MHKDGFTHDQITAFIKEMEPKYPSLDLRICLHDHEAATFFIGVYYMGFCIATVTSEAQFANFIAACQSVALDIEIARMVSNHKECPLCEMSHHIDDMVELADKENNHVYICKGCDNQKTRDAFNLTPIIEAEHVESEQVS